MSRQTAIQIRDCLERQKALFQEYEACAESLCTCKYEDMVNYITEREKLTERIDKISDEICGLCDADPDGDALYAAAKNTSDFDSLGCPEYESVYREGQNVTAIVCRILARQERIIERVQQAKKEQLELIRSLKSQGQVKKYLTGLVGDKRHGIYMSDKNI